ncbi:hypothetical protein LMG29542_03024 [Paraburkholderia humisilvae]|uniref:Uncharacterized protein n=1 Tax=Paraburkholderia humisilvae TaxID=627669 RepID=A0A6J5DTD7_9BURK|nr:hypothetical protein LMG29542_03024 [Paraburkholderia humisilvae]
MLTASLRLRNSVIFIIIIGNRLCFEIMPNFFNIFVDTHRIGREIRESRGAYKVGGAAVHQLC